MNYGLKLKSQTFLLQFSLFFYLRDVFLGSVDTADDAVAKPVPSPVAVTTEDDKDEVQQTSLHLQNSGVMDSVLSGASAPPSTGIQFPSGSTLTGSYYS